MERVEFLQQLPLPDPEKIPAWVHLQFERYETRNAVFIGYEALKQLYPLLQAAHHLEAIEREAFKRMRFFAYIWQSANYRTYITAFEKQVLEAEIEALEKPYATRHVRVERRVLVGDAWRTELVDEYPHDVDWIVQFIQRKLGSFGAIMGKHQILHTLSAIDSVMYACDILGVPVRTVAHRRQVLQHTLRRAA